MIAVAAPARAAVVIGGCAESDIGGVAPTSALRLVIALDTLDLTFELAEAFFRDAIGTADEEEAEVEVASEFDPDSYDPEDFDRFVGRYAVDASPSLIFTFTREGYTIYGQPTGQRRREMVPVSDSTFRLAESAASVTFLRHEDGAVEAAMLHQSRGEGLLATRLAGDAPEVWEPVAEDLADFTGRFFSEEIETFYTFMVEDGELVMHQRRRDLVALTPGEQDNFSGGGMSFAFERDRNGQVIGFYVSNVRTRDVRFGPVR